jgi:hypothetical protein
MIGGKNHRMDNTDRSSPLSPRKELCCLITFLRFNKGQISLGEEGKEI